MALVPVTAHGWERAERFREWWRGVEMVTDADGRRVAASEARGEACGDGLHAGGEEDLLSPYLHPFSSARRCCACMAVIFY